MSERYNLTVQILENPQEILRFLQIGISIPIWTEFHKYILYDLNLFRAKSILLKLDGNIIGHVLIFSTGRDILYFGFFGVTSNDYIFIEYLVKTLIAYAEKNNFQVIWGPINIPTIIFGWGFMEEGSLESLFIAKSINPPLYREIFMEKGFKIKSEQSTWEGPLPRINSEALKEYDLTDYELIHPTDWVDLNKYKEIFLILNARNLAPESIITPNPEKLFDNYLEFMKTYGDIYMVNFARYKPLNKIIGSFVCFPNPFRKNHNGIQDSITGYAIVIDKEHRGKGLGMLMIKDIFDKALKMNIHYMSSTIESKQKESTNIALNKLGLSNLRNHLILEFGFKDYRNSKI